MNKGTSSVNAMRLYQTKPVAEAPLVPERFEVGLPGSGQVRIAVQVCGVCHTDLHTVEGDLELPRLPITPGHQIVGIVEEVGDLSNRFQIGDRVGVAWLNMTCGECEFCRRDLENLCPRARFTGLHADGGYASHVVVNEQFAYPLPARFSAAEAAPLLCAGIIGYRSLRLSGIEPKGRLGLYGFGASAHVAIQVARYWGCDVYVFTRSEDHRHHAIELGAVWTGEASDKPPVELDSAVTFAPAGWIVPHALSHLRPGGTLAVNAIHMSPIPETPYNLIYGERVLRSVANFTRRDALQFLELADVIPVRTDVELYPLTEANQVLERLKSSQIRGAAALEIESVRD